MDPAVLEKLIHPGVIHTVKKDKKADGCELM